MYTKGLIPIYETFIDEFRNYCLYWNDFFVILGMTKQTRFCLQNTLESIFTFVLLNYNFTD